MQFKINKNVLIQEANEPQQGHIRRNIGKYTTAGAIGAGTAAYNYSPEARNHINDIAQKGKDIVEEVFPNHANNLTKSLEVLSEVELDTLYDLLNKVYKAN